MDNNEKAVLLNIFGEFLSLFSSNNGMFADCLCRCADGDKMYQIIKPHVYCMQNNLIIVLKPENGLNAYHCLHDI